MTANEVYEYILNDARERGADIEATERELQCLCLHERFDNTWEFEIIYPSKKKTCSSAVVLVPEPGNALPPFSTILIGREAPIAPRPVLLEVEHDPELGPRYELECNGLGGCESFTSHSEEMINEFLTTHNLVIDRVRTTWREDNKP